MPRIRNALHNEYQLLELLYDELESQAHLFSSYLVHRWQAMEVKWRDIREHLGRAKVSAGDAKIKIDVSAKTHADSLNSGHTEIRNAFKPWAATVVLHARQPANLERLRR